MKNIIIVDMQLGLLNKNNEHLVNKINAYLHNNKFENLFYTMFCNSENSQFVKYLNWNKMTTQVEQGLCVDMVEGGIKLFKCSYGLTQAQIELIKSK